MWKSDEGKTVSYWEETEKEFQTKSLNESIQTDVCVIGGGISGLTAAYLLAKEGRRVVVIDDRTIGGGETARTTAHLSNAIDDRFYRIEDWHGEEKARLAAEAHTAAIDLIERIAAEENIDCDFARLDGYLVFDRENSEDDFEREAASAAKYVGAERVDRLPSGEFDAEAILRFPRQGQFHVLKYLSGLARAVERLGGTIYSETRAVDWTGGHLPEVKTAQGVLVKAQSLVLATNYPIKSRMFAKLPAYRTYAIGARVPKGAVHKALYWDAADPYHYVRLQEEADHDVLIVGGEDHRTGQADDGDARLDNLRAWTQAHFPAAGEVLYRWSGQVFETHDGLAFIGRFSEEEPQVFLITGDSGMGMTHGTLGGRLVADLILERGNAWAEAFDPSRILTQSLAEAIPEIIDSTVPYVDWLKGGDVDSVDEVRPGEGAIISHGTKKIAAYRDEDGRLYRRSAVCTHMGCVVRFNRLEKTWDCPCHGSRFDCRDGHAINTPAFVGLEKAEEEETSGKSA